MDDQFPFGDDDGWKYDEWEYTDDDEWIPDTKQCPTCAMQVPSEAKVCAYCRTIFLSEKDIADREKWGNIFAVAVIVIGLFFAFICIAGGY